jgi:L,D-transpeptidase catalytic domain
VRPVLVTLAVAICFAAVLPGAFGRASAHARPAMIRRNAPDAILVATPRRGKPLVLRNRPAGRVLAVLRRHTELGSPVKLGIAVTRGNWIAVISERLPNGVLGWVPRKRVTVLRIRWSIDVSLSRRLLEVWRNGAVVRRVRAAIGAPRSPTPRGRYVITDHLDARKYGGVYGCCILVLSGHQTHPPMSFDPSVDWRVAIHGGSGIGSAVSAGCLHARDSDLRVLMRLTPLGTPVVITP